VAVFRQLSAMPPRKEIEFLRERQASWIKHCQRG
jgi:hypothetical protein